MKALKYDITRLVEKANDAAKGIHEMIPLVNARMKQEIVRAGTTNDEFIRARTMSSKDCVTEVLQTANAELKESYILVTSTSLNKRTIPNISPWT